jgi:mRNA-degrading endonuclease RelE of RelBE toxin-antitoxin system
LAAYDTSDTLIYISKLATDEFHVIYCGLNLLNPLLFNCSHDLEVPLDFFYSFETLSRKVNEILENPQHYKPLKSHMFQMSRVHVGSFVLVYEKDKARNVVTIRRYEHPDSVYKKVLSKSKCLVGGDAVEVYPR